MQAANNSRRSLKPSKPPRHAPVMTLRGLPADPAHIHFASRRHPQPVGILDAGLLDGAMQLGGLAEPPAEEHQVSSTCRRESARALVAQATLVTAARSAKVYSPATRGRCQNQAKFELRDTSRFISREFLGGSPEARIADAISDESCEVSFREVFLKKYRQKRALLAYISVYPSRSWEPDPSDAVA